MNEDCSSPNISRRKFNALVASMGLTLGVAPTSLVRAACATAPDQSIYTDLLNCILNAGNCAASGVPKPRHTLSKNFEDTAKKADELLKSWNYPPGLYDVETFDGHDDGVFMSANDARKIRYPNVHVGAVNNDNANSLEPVYLVCAHLDTVAGSVGANDNATGAAAVLELARCFQEFNTAGRNPNFPIEFALFGGEEIGLLGSRDVAEFIAPDGEDPIPYRVINLDTLGNGKSCNMSTDPLGPYWYDIEYFQGSDQVKWSTPLINELSGHHVTDRELKGEPLPRYSKKPSDHLAFMERGISVVSISEGVGYDDIHTASDVLCRVNVTSAFSVVQAVYRFLSARIC